MRNLCKEVIEMHGCALFINNITTKFHRGGAMGNGEFVFNLLDFSELLDVNHRLNFLFFNLTNLSFLDPLWGFVSTLSEGQPGRRLRRCSSLP